MLDTAKQFQQAGITILAFFNQDLIEKFPAGSWGE
jgi:hypothetical protein